jgi:hypothetical protein
MREIRQYGSEGGAAGQPAVPTPMCAQQRTPPVEWKSPSGQRLSGPVPEPDCVGREAWVESRGKGTDGPQEDERDTAARPGELAGVGEANREAPLGGTWAACTTKGSRGRRA